MELGLILEDVQCVSISLNIEKELTELIDIKAPWVKFDKRGLVPLHRQRTTLRIAIMLLCKMMKNFD